MDSEIKGFFSAFQNIILTHAHDNFCYQLFLKNCKCEPGFQKCIFFLCQKLCRTFVVIICSEALSIDNQDPKHALVPKNLTYFGNWGTQSSLKHIDYRGDYQNIQTHRYRTQHQQTCLICTNMFQSYHSLTQPILQRCRHNLDIEK